jgi:hypothetical protein
MADLMTVFPAWVTPSRGSAGFAELAEALLAARTTSGKPRMNTDEHR